jgi:uncharacterized protein YkwD
MPAAGSSQSTIRRLCALVVASVAAGSLALAVQAAAARAEGCAGMSAKPSDVSTNATVQATLCLLNHERSRRGLRPLHLNALLTRAALAHSHDMVAHHYFSHPTPSDITPSERVKATGYLGTAPSWVIGENLYWGILRVSSPQDAVDAWMRSPHHKENILCSRYREIGIGIVVGAPRGSGDPAATYTTDFGAKGLILRHGG